MNTHFDPFVIPFTLGVIYLFAVVVWRYVKWFAELPEADRRAFRHALFTVRSLKAVREVVEEALLHKSILRVNPLLWYMHLSFALGWFLLIVIGKFETSAYLKEAFNPPHVHVFFRYFYPEEPFRFHRGFNYAFLMDAVLLFILSGVALAWFKRLRASWLGMKKTTKHTRGDRMALAALWVVFPARLLAESATCGTHQTGDFLTHSTGMALAGMVGPDALRMMELPAWWIYSLALGMFFVAMPYSRYMHIFTEVPHIFLRHYGIRGGDKPGSADNFQIQACSRCGVCIDPCQLQSAAAMNDVQSVYFLRDRRYGLLTDPVADNCLMCGRCETRCPVHIDLNRLRLNSRTARAEKAVPLTDDRYAYLRGEDRSEGTGKVGYFAGCMTLLSAPVMTAMQRIFDAAGEEVWWADKAGGVCCGRPLKLSGETDAARRLMDYNKALFEKHGITTLVTSCPICLKVFREDYHLEGIEVIHHSQYFLRLLEAGRLKLKASGATLTYHDPCELGRGLGIYDEPRAVLARLGTLAEPKQTKKHALCCGGSVANFVLNSQQENRIATDAAAVYAATGAETLVTACPQCKSTFRRNSALPVSDLAEAVAAALEVPASAHRIPAAAGRTAAPAAS